MMAYDAQTLGQRSALCITPTGNLGGIWMAGAAPAIDSDGNLFVTTGNGSFDADRGGANYGMSLLRLTRRLSIVGTPRRATGQHPGSSSPCRRSLTAWCTSARKPNSKRTAC